MSLKLVKLDPKLARMFLIAAAILCIAATWFFMRWNFANAIASRLDLKRPESKQVVDWLIGLGPSDPQTHYAAASLYEKTFDPGDLSRSLSEYELAAALSPNNYLMWINLGKARNLSGDAEGSAMAYKRALDLAPNYAVVQWAYGNLLIRQGETSEGFKLVSKAAASNPDYARNAVTTALQIFDSDIAQVRLALGEGETTNAALAATLASQERFDEAVDSWSKLPADGKIIKYKQLGETLAGQLMDAKKFQLAAIVISDLQVNNAEKPVIGQVANGGFEQGIKLRGAGVFDWQIAEGVEPQIGLSNAQKRSGEYGLLIVFNSFETSAFRTISQTVAVVPGTEYEFEGFYRSDLKTTASMKIEIADAATAGTIASTPPLPLAGDWTTMKVRFTVPLGGDGIIIRLAREGCAGPACRITGRLSFDDFSIYNFK